MKKNKNLVFMTIFLLNLLSCAHFFKRNKTLFTIMSDYVKDDILELKGFIETNHKQLKLLKN